MNQNILGLGNHLNISTCCVLFYSYKIQFMTFLWEIFKCLEVEPLIIIINIYSSVCIIELCTIIYEKQQKNSRTNMFLVQKAPTGVAQAHNYELIQTIDHWLF